MVYAIYKTDVHHSYASRDMIAIATDKGKAIVLIEKQVVKDGDTITPDQVFNLQNYKQTQGHEGDNEFQFEEIKTDVLL